MTIRGALSDLDNLLKADDIPFYYKPSIKAVMDTIALSSSEKPNNSTTKNDLGVDCILRADAIGSIAVECSAEKLDIDYAKFLMLRRAIKALPTVTPIRPKGHWIVEKGGSYLGKRNACCSNCKDFYSSDWNVFNYCPNCGAKMESEE